MKGRNMATIHISPNFQAVSIENILHSPSRNLEGTPLMQRGNEIVFLINRSNSAGLQVCSDRWRETNDSGWEKMHAPPFALKIPGFVRLMGLQDFRRASRDRGWGVALIVLRSLCFCDTTVEIGWFIWLNRRLHPWLG